MLQDTDEKKSADQLLVLQGATEPMFDGLPLAFDDENVNDESTILNQYKIPYDTYRFTVMNINHVLYKHLPCVGWMVCLGAAGFVTCGLAWIPLCFSMGPKAKQELKKFLQQQNDQVYAAFGVQWQLVDSGNYRGCTVCLCKT